MKIHLKVAKFYRRLYGGVQVCAPTTQTPVKFRDFAELYLPNVSMSKVEKTVKRSICLSFCIFFSYRFRVDLGTFHEV